MARSSCFHFSSSNSRCLAMIMNRRGSGMAFLSSLHPCARHHVFYSLGGSVVGQNIFRHRLPLVAPTCPYATVSSSRQAVEFTARCGREPAGLASFPLHGERAL